MSGAHTVFRWYKAVHTCWPVCLMGYADGCQGAGGEVDLGKMTKDRKI